MSMTDETYHLLGRVIDPVTGDGIEGLVVEAWDKDLMGDDLLGSAATDETGNFHISFSSLDFREAAVDRRPDPYFTVSHQGNVLANTDDFASEMWIAC